MKVTILSIHHSEQRYETCGDWWFSPTSAGLEIRVSRLPDPRAEALVAVHELVEALLCSFAGITSGEVDEFDMAFEAARQPGNTDEPGDNPRAPYHVQHQFASHVEREMAAQLSLDWSRYEEMIAGLTTNTPLTSDGAAVKEQS